MADSAPEIPEVTEPAEAEKLPATFAELGLSEPILQNLNAAGFTKPTPIQAAVIPVAMTGRDVMGQAKTGTGKTAAFLLPAFERLKPGGSKPSVMILAPTRELALQIHGEFERLGKGLGFRSVTLYGGSSYDPQIAALNAGVDIIVGTPGRLMDHMRSRRLDLSGLKLAVLDEADRMLDLGFRKDIEYILRHCPPTRQTLLLSATIADDIQTLARRFMNDPEVIWTAPETITVDQVEQFYLVVDRDKKFPALLKILDEERPNLAIIFCGTKIAAKKLAGKLQNLYINAREIHGDLVQSKREKIMGHFRKGRVQILVATDVASRGIDVQDITHIINYDIPFKQEDYVHRIGRTGRMERNGKAYTLLTKEEGPLLTDIELFINRELQRVDYPTFDSRFWPNPPAAPLPEFTAGDSETLAQADDYISDDEKDGHKGKSDSKGGRRGGRRGKHGKDGDRPARSAPAHSHSGNGGHAPAAQGGQAKPHHDHLDDTAHAEIAPLTFDPDATHGDGEVGDEIEGTGPHSGFHPAPELPATGHAAPAREDGERRRRRGGRGGRSRPRGEPVEVVCSGCGVTTRVPFTPDPSRPVYCDLCYTARKSERKKGPAQGDSSVSEELNPAAPMG